MPETPPRTGITEAQDTPCDRLANALAEAGLAAGIRALQPMADTGLAHHHVWLQRAQGDWVARLPKQSQLGLTPRLNLDYQAACFARASRGGHAPALHGILPPTRALPRGGLLVEAVVGRPARLPQDLPAIAEALASLHRLALPPPASRPPLLSPADPWAAMLDEVQAQAGFVDQAGLDAATRRRLEEELSALPPRLASGPAAVPRLISFDAHPGNFLVTGAGRAMLVDLEKCRYGLPGFDLAHASLYTSTTWDVQSHAVLTTEEVATFYQHWIAATEVDGDVATLLACRRAMWLWSLTWCAKWRASHASALDGDARGEDWSAELSDERLVDHVRERVDHYLSCSTLDQVREEFDALEHALSRG